LLLVPYLACKPFQYYPIGQVNQVCRDVRRYTDDMSRKVYHNTRYYTCDRGLLNLKRFYRSSMDLKDSISTSLSDVLSSVRSSLFSSVHSLKDRVEQVVRSTKENAKEYRDAGVHRLHDLIEELERERDKYLGPYVTVTFED
jgi:ElaB/YqjD/DUF883 family membrane-anchored ribosome-binding protein